jgi:hypothetical protein
MRPMPPIQPNLFKIQSWSARSHQPRAPGRGSDQRSVRPSRASFRLLLPPDEFVGPLEFKVRARGGAAGRTPAPCRRPRR